MTTETKTERRMLISNKATRDFEELLRDFDVKEAATAPDGKTLSEWAMFSTAVVDAIEKDGNELDLLLPPHLAACMLEVELKCRALVGQMLVDAATKDDYRRGKGQLWEDLEWGVNALHFFQHWRQKLQGTRKDEYGNDYIPNPGEECDVAPDEDDEAAAAD
jgi:hypothetical protein